MIKKLTTTIKLKQNKLAMIKYQFAFLLMIFTLGFCNCSDKSISKNQEYKESIKVYNDILSNLFDTVRISNPDIDLLYANSTPDSFLLNNSKYTGQLINHLYVENIALRKYILKKWIVLLVDSLVPPMPIFFNKSASMAYQSNVDTVLKSLYDEKIKLIGHYKIIDGTLRNHDKYTFKIIDSIPKYKWGDKPNERDNIFYLKLSTVLFNSNYSKGILFAGFYTYPNNWGTGHFVYIEKSEYNWRIIKVK